MNEMQDRLLPMPDPNVRWEGDGLWVADPAAEEVSRMLDTICHRCDRAWNECDCAEHDPWEEAIAARLRLFHDSHDQRADDVEIGIPMRHAHPDDQWESD